MIGKLQNDIITLYDQNNIWVGDITTESNFKNAQISIGDKTYELSKNKRKIEVLEEGLVIAVLKFSLFFLSLEIIETGHKIKGVKGFKWGTKMEDRENNTLLKIRHKNLMIDENIYIIEISNEKTTYLEVLLTLYAHLYGSNLKLYFVLLLGSAASVVISARILNW